MKVLDQHDQRIADAAELLAVGGDVGQHLFLDLGLARLAEIDVDQAELAAGHERRERIDRLHDVAGQRQLEGGHGWFLSRVGLDTRRGSPAGRLYLWWCDLGRSRICSD